MLFKNILENVWQQTLKTKAKELKIKNLVSNALNYCQILSLKCLKYFFFSFVPLALTASAFIRYANYYSTAYN